MPIYLSSHFVIDLPTLCAVTVFILAAGGLLMLFCWVQNRTMPALAFWGRRLSAGRHRCGTGGAGRAHTVELGDLRREQASVYRLLKAHDLITSPAFIVVKAADEFKDKTTAPNQLWQTDFTYLKVIGWGWFYLSTILDDFSRYIIAWKLCTTMKADDVTDTLKLALTASGCSQARVVHKPRLLSDNGSSYVSGDLAKWLVAQGMRHVRGAPCHPQTQGKIERWHQTLKNRILLENYYLPGDLEASISRFVDHYNHQRYHESLNNLTPADVYLGRGQTILLNRERIKRSTIQNRRLLHQNKAA